MIKPETLDKRIARTIRDRKIAGTGRSPSHMSGIDAYTVLMLHMDGVDQSTTFTDSSYAGANSPHTVTANGNAQIDTAQSKFGGASGLFVATSGNFVATSSQYLSVDDSADWALGTGDFTIDFWVKYTSLPASGKLFGLYDQYKDTSHRFEFSFYNNAGTYVYILRLLDGSDLINKSCASGTPTLGTWYHIALVRNGSDWYVFQNGTQIDTTLSSTASIPNLAATVLIGNYRQTAGSYLDGHLDEYRISNTARWTTTFTVPTDSYVSDANTLLLLHMKGDNASTTFTDSSTGGVDSPHAVTSQPSPGGVSIDDSTNVFGGYLSIPDSVDWYLGTGDFTIDFWVRFTALPAINDHQYVYGQLVDQDNRILIIFGKVETGYYWQFGVHDGGTITITANSEIALPGWAIDTWYHIALVRSGSTFTWYKDGVTYGTTASESDPVPDLAAVVAVGRKGNMVTGTFYYLKGWLDEYRVSKGVARWTSNFTPPTRAYSYLDKEVLGVADASIGAISFGGTDILEANIRDILYG